MSARKPILILALGAIVAAGLLGWAWRHTWAREALRRAIAVERATQMHLQAELAAARKLGAVKVANIPVAGGAIPATEPTAPKRERLPSLADAAREHPQLWNDFISFKRVELKGDYAAFFRRAGLTAEQRDRVLEILAQGLARDVDIGAAARAKDMSFDDPLVRKLHEEAKSQTDAQLAEYLGPARYAELERFQRTEQVRGYVDGLAVQVAEFAPLSPQQADRLEEAIAGASPEFRVGQRAQPQTLEWAEIDRQAKEILTPAQYAMWVRGSAHNPIGGSRRDLEFRAAYERAIAKAKAQGGG